MIKLTENILSLSHWLPTRAEDANKWDFGHVFLVGGDKGFGGAVRLAGEAALRTGAGMVSVITRVAHRSGLLAGCPELMVHALSSKNSEFVLSRATVLIIGPGMGRAVWGKNWWAALKKTALLRVIDADALNALAESPFKDASWILTPHYREAARLLDCSIEDIENNREKAITQLVKKYGGVVILKGHHTLIQGEGSDIFYCSLGNSGMATAGMGDILSGILGGLLAQKIPLIEAAKLGVYLHAAAGDSAAEAGMRGMVASDLLPFIRFAVNV
jgi:NAD(P)H-hydrate epimerase